MPRKSQELLQVVCINTHSEKPFFIHALCLVLARPQTAALFYAIFRYFKLFLQRPCLSHKFPCNKPHSFWHILAKSSQQYCFSQGVCVIRKRIMILPGTSFLSFLSYVSWFSDLLHNRLLHRMRWRVTGCRSIRRMGRFW